MTILEITRLLRKLRKRNTPQVKLARSILKDLATQLVARAWQRANAEMN